MTWINCGNYIQLSRFFMYPNTTAENFIARHVFIVSHPLQGHHQRYSSKPEIPPKADRRSTQSTMKSVMIRHHEICIQGTHPSVPHLPEPAIKQWTLYNFTDPISFSLSACSPFWPFDILTLWFSPSILRLDHHCKHIRRGALYGWMNGVKSWRWSKDDYEVFWSGVSKFLPSEIRVKLRVKQIQSCLHLQLEYSRCHSQAAWRPCFNTENQKKMISSTKHTCLQKVAVDDCLAKWFKLYEHAINASSAGSAVHCIQCSSWSFLARSSFSAFLPRKLNSAEASNKKMQTKMINNAFK